MAGHLLKSVNPDAVERAAAAPMPGVGTMVLYWPRPAEARRGRFKVPALVMAVDESNRHLDLIVFQEAHDMIDQQRVPEHVENERGWSRMLPVAMGESVGEVVLALKSDVAKLRNIVLGDFEVPKQSVIELLDAMDERMGKIEDAAKPARLAASEPAKDARAKVGRRRFRNAG